MLLFSWFFLVQLEEDTPLHMAAAYEGQIWEGIDLVSDSKV